MSENAFTRDEPGRGQELTREELVERLILPLRARYSSAVLAVAGGAGNIILAPDAALVRVPRVASLDIDEGAAWVGEAQPIGEAAGAIDELRLLPSTLRSLKCLVSVSTELLSASPVDLLDRPASREGGMPADWGTVTEGRLGLGSAVHRLLGRVLDREMLRGAGDPPGERILGVRNVDGVQEIDADGAPLDLDMALEAHGAVLAELAQPSAFLMAPATFNALRRLKDGVERFQLEPDPAAGARMSLLGAPIILSAEIAADELWALDGSALFVAFAGARIEVSPHARFDSDEVLMRVVMRGDVGLAHPEALAVVHGFTLAPEDDEEGGEG